MIYQRRIRNLAWLCLFVLALTLIITYANTNALSQGCAPPECYPEPPPEEPPPGEPPQGGSWSGYSDGRLNPAMDEYYSVWCANNVIEVWGGTPNPQLINAIPLLAVYMLSEGETLDAGNGLIVTRNTADTITIYGSNGNGTPNPGSKSFSLNECIARNGGLPEIPGQPEQNDGDDTQVTDNSVPGDDADPAEDPASRRREAEERLDFCFASFDFLEDAWLFVGCLNDTLQEYQDVLISSEIISLVLTIFCLNIIVGNGILPIGIVLFLGWRRRRRVNGGK